ncbi:MAG: hypothetical protein EP338_06140 [Bacteroidetes bacterium]|nr:MAG: hypothetical protein EP338_06140 [Bacteroidota bacterium]
MRALLFTAFSLFIFGLFSQTKDRLPCVDKKFSVVAHIFRDTTGLENISESQIISIFDKVNQDFAPICISFEVCEFQYHDNFQYDQHARDPDWDEMQNLYHVKNRINVYYVKTIEDPAGACGYAGLGDITNFYQSGIVIQKTGSCCQTTSKTHSHELGHYFGLPHTFAASGVTDELVDASNCATSGDQICDTPADPYIDGTPPSQWVVDCRFINTLKDANDEFYDPLVGNIMSYYPDECSCGFTDDQFKQMVKTYLAKIGQW